MLCVPSQCSAMAPVKNEPKIKKSQFLVVPSLCRTQAPDLSCVSVTNTTAPFCLGQVFLLACSSKLGTIKACFQIFLKCVGQV